MDPILIHKEEQIRFIEAGVNLSCSYHKMVEFCILREGKKAKSGIISPDFSRGDYHIQGSAWKDHMADGNREKGPQKHN